MSAARPLLDNNTVLGRHRSDTLVLASRLHVVSLTVYGSLSTPQRPRDIAGWLFTTRKQAEQMLFTVTVTALQENAGSHVAVRSMTVGRWSGLTTGI